MTERTVVRTSSAPEAIGPYSQAIVAGDLVWCSGQIGLDPATGEMVPGGVAEQTHRALENLRAVLGECGLGFSDVLKTTVYLTDMDDFGAVNSVYAGYFSDAAPPARATVAVAALPKGALVEIDCVARRD